MVTPEAKYITTNEQGQYWGGYFAANLRPYLIAHLKQRAYDPDVVRTTYIPSLNVFDARRQRLDLLQQHFGGIL